MVQVPTIEPLSAENMLWANTVLAAGSAIGFVVYTGPETRAVMNTSHPQTKVGLLDHEISQLAKVCRSLNLPGSARADCVRKILCAVSFVLSVVLVALNGFRGTWYIYVFRFLILFSSIIPIRWAIKVKRADNELNSEQFTGQSGHGKDRLRPYDHERQADPRHDRTHQHFTRRTRPNRVSSQ